MFVLLVMEVVHHVVKGTADEINSLLDNAGVVMNPRLFRDGRCLMLLLRLLLWLLLQFVHLGCICTKGRADILGRGCADECAVVLVDACG